MFNFSSVSVSKDGGAHYVALRAYYIHDVIKIAILEERQPLLF